MPRSTFFQARVAAIFLAALFSQSLLPGRASASSQEISVRSASAGSLPQRFVERILSQSGPAETFSLEVHNLSTLPRSASDLRGDFEAAFQRFGRRLTPTNEAAVRITITVSENQNDYVWIAEVLKGADRVLVLGATPRDVADALQNVAPSYVIRKHLLYASAEQILDVDEPTSDPTAHVALVLTPESVIQYSQRADGNWQEEKRVEVRRSPVRDLRGRIVSLNDVQRFEIYMPGTKCTGSVIPNLIATCQQSDDPWPVTAVADGPRAFFSGTRNFFMGLLAAGHSNYSLNPFFSAALLQADNSPRMVVTATDGMARYFEGSDQPHATYTARGDDVAAISADCGGPAMLLGTGAGDWNKPDSLQLFRPQNERLAAVSAATEMTGPVVALWPASASQVHAIVRNLQTGNYEVYTIIAACSH